MIDHLLLKGRQEYQETMNFWKQKDHVMGKLLAPRGRPQRSFLQKFYEGTPRCLFLMSATMTFGIRTRRRPSASGRNRDPAAQYTLDTFYLTLSQYIGILRRQYVCTRRKGIVRLKRVTERWVNMASVHKTHNKTSVESQFRRHYQGPYRVWGTSRFVAIADVKG